MKNEETSGLMQPFNIPDSEARAAMFSAQPPQNLTLSLFFRLASVPLAAGKRSPRGRLFWKYWDEPEPEKVLVDLAKSCIAHSDFPDMECEVTCWSEDDDVIDVIDQLPISPMQEFRWEIGVLAYPQVGFRDHKSFGDNFRPHRAIYSAMTVSDIQYVHSGSLNPKDHAPIIVSKREETVFRLAVNDVYRLGLGVWCSALVNLRNEVRIKADAIVHGADPDERWKSFCDAGFVHHLDYVRTRQPPESKK